MLGLLLVLAVLVVAATGLAGTTEVVRRVKRKRLTGTSQVQAVDGVKAIQRGFRKGVDHRHGAHGSGAFLQAGNAFVHASGSVDDQAPDGQ
jgi:hypothetical protein